MADVFISYKRTERARVEKIAELLTASGLSVWFDARLTPGSSDGFDAEINREIEAAAAVLVCWTPEAVLSTYVRAESKVGLARGVLAPAMLEPCKLPIPFNDIDACNLIGWDGDPNHPEWMRIVAQVRQLTSRSHFDRTKLHAAIQSAADTRDHFVPALLESLLERIVERQRTIHLDYGHCGKMLEVIRRITAIDKTDASDTPAGLEDAVGSNPHLQPLLSQWEAGEIRAFTEEEYRARCLVREMAQGVTDDITDVLSRDNGYRRPKRQ